MQILESKADKSGIRSVLQVISDGLVRRAQISAKTAGMDQPGVRTSAETVSCHTKASQPRITGAVARLQCPEAKRQNRGDSRFGKTTENRVAAGLEPTDAYEIEPLRRTFS
jgi:hypothetical protein